MDQIDLYIDRVQHLPPAPTVATELLELFKQPDPDIDRIVQLISHDPAFTAEVLKRCNSTYFGGGKTVTDMFDAVVRIGFYEIYCIVVAIIGSRALALASSEGGLVAGTLWHHSVNTAVTAGTLATLIKEDAAVAFTAGLLHDVGKLILASVEPAAYAKLIAESENADQPFVDREKAALGVTHAAVGARLLARWRLPSDCACAVLHHHTAPSLASAPMKRLAATVGSETELFTTLEALAAPMERLAAIVNLANQLEHCMTHRPDGVSDIAARNPEILSILQLNADEMPMVIRKTEEDLKRVEGLLQI